MTSVTRRFENSSPHSYIATTHEPDNGWYGRNRITRRGDLGVPKEARDQVGLSCILRSTDQNDFAPSHVELAGSPEQS
jgi:hypothetical protein